MFEKGRLIIVVWEASGKSVGGDALIGQPNIDGIYLYYFFFNWTSRFNSYSKITR